MRTTAQLLGTCAGILFVIAAVVMWYNASKMIDLRSVSGNSVAESFYQGMGGYGVAYGMMSFGAGMLVFWLTSLFTSSRLPEMLTEVPSKAPALSQASLTAAPPMVAAPPPPAPMQFQTPEPVVEQKFSYCAKCGNRNPANAATCERCGVAVGRSSAQG